MEMKYATSAFFAFLIIAICFLSDTGEELFVNFLYVVMLAMFLVGLFGKRLIK